MDSNSAIAMHTPKSNYFNLDLTEFIKNKVAMALVG